MTAPQAGATLTANKERIIALWVERLRSEVPAAANEAHLILVDTLPAVLDYLAQALNPDEPRPVATHGSTIAAEHGGERVRLTHFRLEDLITEYRLLRQVLFEVLEETGRLSPAERNVVHGSLDQALTEACTGYSLVQSRLREERFAFVAHDLRNPLNAVSMAAQVLLHGAPTGQLPQLANRIIENVARAERMVKDILEVASIGMGGRLQLNIEACDLVEIVNQSLVQLRHEHGDRFVVKAPEPVPGYFAPDEMRRAFENLATNAVRHGADSMPITVTVSRGHGRAIIAVHNFGVHIPADRQETLFRAFQRSSSSERNSQRGWGLGLAQVRAVAEAHGGSITVDSVPESGTTFIIDVPEDARRYQDGPLPRWDATSEEQ